MATIEHANHNAGSSGTYVLTLLAAVTAGAAAGLLLAPKSGKELRGDIKNKSRDLKNQAEDTATDVKQSVADTAHDVRSRAGRLKDDVADALHGTAEEVADESRGVTRRAKNRAEAR